jgi:hypothetical protein
MAGPLNGPQVNGVSNELGTTGNVVSRVNALETSIGSNPGIIQIPANEPDTTGSGNTTTGWNPPPNGMTILDQRNFNGGGSFANEQPFLKNSQSYFINAGALSSFESNANSGQNILDLESIASAGAPSAGAGVVDDLLMFNKRTGGSRPIEAMDIQEQYANLDNIATAIEIDMVNLSGTNDSGATGIGINLVGGAGGNANGGTGISCEGNSITNWEMCLALQGYAQFGIAFRPTATRGADMLFVPPANDNNSEIIGTNTSGTHIWGVDDSGNFFANTFNGTSTVSAGGPDVSGVPSGGIIALNGVGFFSDTAAHTVDVPLIELNSSNKVVIDATGQGTIFNGSVVITPASLTVGGASVPMQSATTPTVGTIACWKTTTTLGTCSALSGVTCTACN